MIASDKIPACCTYHACGGVARTCSEEDPHTRAARDYEQCRPRLKSPWDRKVRK